MRGLKSFGGLVVILIALGAYLYFVDSKHTPGDDLPKKDKVFTIEADKIDEISIKSESGDKTTLRKTGTAWDIVQPALGRPDESEISGLTSSLASLEMQRVIDENATDLKEYGLAEPRVEVAFKSGGQERKLQIGMKSPTGTDLYARLADQPKVFLIASFLDTTFNRTTFDLRDKTVLKIDREKVDALEVATAGRTMKFERANGEWRMAQPVATVADSTAVDGLVGQLNGAKMKSMASGDSTDLEPFGLAKPAATVRVGTGSSQATLLVGGPAAEGTVYAKDLSRPAVFTIESSLLDELKKEAGEFRLKDLFAARVFNATRIEVTRNGQTVAFEKAKVKAADGKDEEKWRKALPTPADADGPAVEALISAATAARATTFVDSTAKTGLDKPELTIAVKSDEGKEDRVTFGRSGADGYAARADMPGAAKIETATIDAIIAALDAAQKPPAPPTPPAPTAEKK